MIGTDGLCLCAGAAAAVACAVVACSLWWWLLLCCQPYFSHWHHLATDGLSSGLMTYILFWTLMYDVCYIY